MSSAKVVFLIGHRGVGKTSLALALGEEFCDLNICDLDQQIEKETQKSINDFFSQEGEEKFRIQEQKTFTDLLVKINRKTDQNIVVLGAGFQFDLPEGYPVFWIQRKTDLSGRVFLDRPRLNKDQTVLQEFFSRRDARQGRFSKISDFRILIPEGFSQGVVHGFYDLYLEPYFSLEIKKQDHKNLNRGILTIPANWNKENQFVKKHIESYLQKGIFLFELRDDLLSKEQIDQWREFLPQEKILISFRQQAVSSPIVLNEGGFVDWALELGEPPGSGVSVLSRHEFDAGEEGLEKGLQDLTERQEKESSLFLKAAPYVETWQELILGHRWFLQNPEQRSFLPRSCDGRWQWYRFLHMDQENRKLMKLNFFSEGLNTEVLDQPSFLQRVSLWQLKEQKGQTTCFAAILGNPVNHSLTPTEQESFFAQRGWPVVAIDLKEEEFSQEILDFLKELGLRAAAVTSPLKQKIIPFCSADFLAQSLQSVNTIYWQGKTGFWLGTNTDQRGFQSLCRMISSEESVLVWGGGGTLEMIQSVLPQAEMASSRSGKLREGSPLKDHYDVVIWAAGQRGQGFPELCRRPRLVVDLSYMENSRGREFCLQWSPAVDYCSGLEMFREQAQGQRDYFKELMQD